MRRLDLHGLSGLTTIRTVFIIENPLLSSVSGLSGLRSSSSPGRPPIPHVPALVIQGNPSLKTLDGLSDLTSLVNLDIYDNDSLSNVDALSGVTQLTGYLSIRENGALTDVNGLSALTSVQEEVAISGNSSLAHVDGLSSLDSVGSTVWIESNPVMTNVDGLSGLTTVGQSLIVRDNAELGSCNCGLYDLITSGGVMGGISIESNAPGCNTITEIEAAGSCTLVATEQQEAPPDVLTLHQNYPNPFTNTTTIRYELPEVRDVRLTVFDALGRQVARLVDRRDAAGTFDVRWDVGDLGSGAYFYRLDADGFVETRSMFLAKTTPSIR